MPTETKHTTAIHVYFSGGRAARLEAERHAVLFDAAENPFPVPGSARCITRDFAEVHADELPGGPVTLSTYADLVQLLERCGEHFETYFATAEKERAEKSAAVQKQVDAARAAAAGSWQADMRKGGAKV